MKDDYDAFTFDLDGTLAVSKSPIADDMSAFLGGLLEKGKTVGVISGGALPQFQKQVVSRLSCDPAHLAGLCLMPTCGAAMYAWDGGSWQEVYAHPIEADEYDRICRAFDTVFEQASFPRPEAHWGEQIEHRGAQVTFSAFGQQAPIEEKQRWEEPGSNAKKQELVALIAPLLPEYSVRAGGTTSVDITRKGIDKQFGIERFLEHRAHAPERVLFAGDALYEGGNDHPVTLTGVDVCAVENPQDLLAKLARFAHNPSTTGVIRIEE